MWNKPDPPNNHECLVAYVARKFRVHKDEAKDLVESLRDGTRDRISEYKKVLRDSFAISYVWREYVDFPSDTLIERIKSGEYSLEITPKGLRCGWANRDDDRTPKEILEQSLHALDLWRFDRRLHGIL